jgi:hypothetical protein
MRARAFIAGIIGAALLAIASAFARRAGIPMDLERLQGSFFTGADGARDAATYVIGLIVQLAIGGVLGLIYGAILARTPHPSLSAGAFLGLIHALIAGVLLALVPALHPAVPEAIAAPGLLMSGLGTNASFVFVLLHVGFGILMAALASPHEVGQHAAGAAVPSRGERQHR